MVGMNKLPTKQIYLLMVIITGIITLSVYSTYALFTFESETTEAFNIQLPSVLKIKTDMYEYKQITIPKNSVQTTDIDLYNTYDYELCYSIWYKVLGKDSSLIDIYEVSDTNLSTNGTISATTNSRFTILIINNSNQDTKINVGLAAIQANETCSLKLSSDKKNIKKIYDKPIISLTEHILTNENKTYTDEQNGSLIYKNKTVELSFSETINLANNYTIKDKNYILSSPEEITNIEYLSKLNNLDYSTNNYYICSTKSCETIYRINSATVTTDTNTETGEVNYQYQVTNVDEYEVYNKGTSGIKKVNNDYYYYGDNPHNFVYYNCKNDDITSCELWRIIGLIYDEQNASYKLKIIRNDSIGKYQYHNNTSSNDWKLSKLYKQLNDKYSLDLTYMSIYPHIYEEISSLDVSLADIPNTKITTKNREVTLLNLSDYVNASTCSQGLVSSFTTCLDNNWLNRANITQEWTLTAYENLKLDESINESTTDTQTETVSETQENNSEEDLTNDSQQSSETTENQPTDTETTDTTDNQNNTDVITEPENEVIEKQMYTVGNQISSTIVTEKLAVRPVIYLQERMLFYSGNGTIESPYILK